MPYPILVEKEYLASSVGKDEDSEDVERVLHGENSISTGLFCGKWTSSIERKYVEGVLEKT
jgi:hypothetical protein